MKRDYILIGIVSLIVIFALIAGFIAVGGPGQARDQKFDEERVQDIQSLKSSIQNYYYDNKILPKTLSALDSTSYNYDENNKKDPQTGHEYEYSTTSSIGYKICATFNLDSSEKKDSYSYYGYNKEFQHPKGYHCFTFKVQGSQTSSVKKQTTTLLDEKIKEVTTDAKSIDTTRSNFPYGFFSNDPNEYGLLNSESITVTVTVKFKNPVKIKSISNTFPLCGYSECETWSVVGTTSKNETKQLITDAKVPGDKTGKRITTQAVTAEDEFNSTTITMTPRLATKSHLFWEKLKFEYK